MAAGLPIVATNVGGIPYVVENGKNGLLCKYGDTRAMAEMITQLLDDKQKYQTFSIAAQKAAQSYNWKHIANKLEFLYTQLT